MLIEAPAAPLFASELVTVTGMLVVVVVPVAMGSVVLQVPAGAFPIEPYFHASSATRSVCSARSVAPVRSGPAGRVPNFANAAAARKRTAIDSATTPHATAASMSVNASCLFTHRKGARMRSSGRSKAYVTIAASAIVTPNAIKV